MSKYQWTINVHVRKHIATKTHIHFIHFVHIKRMKTKQIKNKLKKYNDNIRTKHQ